MAPSSSFEPHFVKALLRHLGRRPPIDAKNDPDIVQIWLSYNEPRRDLIAHSSALYNMKAKFIIRLSYLTLYEQVSTAQHATSQYTNIYLEPSPDEKIAMKFLSAEKNKQSEEAYSIYWNNFEQYLRRIE